MVEIGLDATFVAAGGFAPNPLADAYIYSWSEELWTQVRGARWSGPIAIGENTIYSYTELYTGKCHLQL